MSGFESQHFAHRMYMHADGDRSRRPPRRKTGKNIWTATVGIAAKELTDRTVHINFIPMLMTHKQLMTHLERFGNPVRIRICAGDPDKPKQNWVYGFCEYTSVESARACIDGGAVRYGKITMQFGSAKTPISDKLAWDAEIDESGQVVRKAAVYMGKDHSKGDKATIQDCVCALFDWPANCLALKPGPRDGEFIVDESEIVYGVKDLSHGGGGIHQNHGQHHPFHNNGHGQQHHHHQQQQQHHQQQQQQQQQHGTSFNGHGNGSANAAFLHPKDRAFGHTTAAAAALPRSQQQQQQQQQPPSQNFLFQQNQQHVDDSAAKQQEVASGLQRAMSHGSSYTSALHISHYFAARRECDAVAELLEAPPAIKEAWWAQRAKLALLLTELALEVVREDDAEVWAKASALLELVPVVPLRPEFECLANLIAMEAADDPAQSPTLQADLDLAVTLAERALEHEHYITQCCIAAGLLLEERLPLAARCLLTLAQKRAAFVLETRSDHIDMVLAKGSAATRTLKELMFPLIRNEAFAKFYFESFAQRMGPQGGSEPAAGDLEALHPPHHVIPSLMGRRRI